MQERLPSIRIWLLVLASANAGCFTTNPAIPDDEAMDESSDSHSASSSPPTGNDTDDTDSDTTGSTPTGDSGTACSEEFCGLGVPTGWSGPFYRSDEPDNAAQVTLFADVEAPESTCGCGCGPVDDARCEDLVFQRFDDDACETFAFESELVQPPFDEPACLTHTPQGSVRAYSTPLDCSETVCPTCEPVEQFDVPPPVETGVTTYTQVNTIDCGDDVGECIVTEGQQVCILREGEHECPLDYSIRTIAFSTVDDTRTCTACGCAAPEGIACAATITTFSGNSCDPINEVGSEDVPSPGGSSSCLDVPTGGSYLVEPVLVEPGSCAPLGGQPTGAAQPAGPHTVCCVEG